ncbi:MAG: TlpA family protein disulfide reductase [Deltaproteobacteria bacterium]
MLRRLLPVCMSLALWGCNASTPPAGDSAAPAAGASSREVAHSAPQPAESGSADKRDDASALPPAGERGKVATPDATTREGGDQKTPGPDAAPKEPAAASVEAAMTKLRRARTPKARQRAAADLEKALAGEPDNVDGLLMMVRAAQLLIEDADDEDEPTEALHHKAVVFLNKALKAEPELLNLRGFKPFAAEVYYEDACALAREKKPSESLALLGKAVEFGSSPEEVNDEEDLAAVRKLPEFAPLMAEATGKFKAAVAKEIAQLLAENESFEFHFDLEDIAGNKLSKADLKGKVLIVDFWGTWCPPCRLEIPHFVALDREYRGQGLQIVGLNSEREDDAEASAKLVREFCEKEGVGYPCALVNDEVIEQVPDFEGFPTTLFVDRTGKVRMKATGYHSLPFLRAAVEALLSEKVAEADAKPAEKKGE